MGTGAVRFFFKSSNKYWLIEDFFGIFYKVWGISLIFKQNQLYSNQLKSYKIKNNSLKYLFDFI